ncbi:MAG: hypothetical protein E6Y83_19385 [Clostridium butyricum]|nr:hypothetical protein [Clostridium butyricum]
MIRYNSIRWKRLEELGMEFSYVKNVIRTTYNYQIREQDISEFRKNISSYKKITEVELLNLLENETYNKISIFSIMKYKKDSGKEPVIDCISTVLLNQMFREKNNIDFIDGEYYNGELDDGLKVVYYNKNNNFAIIKLACVISDIDTQLNEDGTEDGIPIEVYDCCKFIIDLENRIVIMCYNDIVTSSLSSSKQITIKKTAFRLLFNISSKGILKYDVSRYLMKYI